MSLFSIFKDSSKTPHSGSITHIASGTVLSGDLLSESPVYFFGTITGNIKSGGDVYIGEEAEVFGHVTSPNIYMAGKVLGNITCTKTVYLKGTAAVLGNLCCSEVTIEKGALVAGVLKVESEKLHAFRQKSVNILSEGQMRASNEVLLKSAEEPVLNDKPEEAAPETPVKEAVRNSAETEAQTQGNGQKPQRVIKLPRIIKVQSTKETPRQTGDENSYDYPKNIW
ncbi:MAG: hypothetical protein AMXMBFR48_12470 [Ignavibacteriales bacterium]